MVKPGDTIAKDQAVLELETDKATIEVPSSVAGTVKDVKVKAGDKVKVGQAILSVDDGAGAKPTASKDASAKSAEAAPKSGTEGGKPTPAKDPSAKSTEAAPANAGGEGGKAESRPAVQPRDQPAKPDKSGVKDPTIGPQAAAGVPGGDEAPAPRKNVVDINRGARAVAEPAAAPELPP